MSCAVVVIGTLLISSIRQEQHLFVSSHLSHASGLLSAILKINSMWYFFGAFSKPDHDNHWSLTWQINSSLRQFQHKNVMISKTGGCEVMCLNSHVEVWKCCNTNVVKLIACSTKMEIASLKMSNKAWVHGERHNVNKVMQHCVYVLTCLYKTVWEELHWDILHHEIFWFLWPLLKERPSLVTLW